jgi:rhodanese-related sulfurtransferase
MSVKRVTPPEAAALLNSGVNSGANSAWKYVDVRSIPEFLDGHPAGSYNVPLLHLVPGRGMTPNADFEKVMTARFAKDEKLVLGCRSGGRSFRAVEMLQAVGFSSVVDMQGGWDGERDPMGRVAVVGWRDAGLPSAKTAEPGKSYEELSSAK